MRHDPTTLPADLPRPTDDGAAAHLVGMPVPSCPLPSTSTDVVDLFSSSQQSRLVVFAYPRTGRPGVDPPFGWDAIPGARGCTPEACAFRDVSEQFRALGVEVYGLSTQETVDQREAAALLRLPYPLLSDAGLELTTLLRLPTFTVAGMTLLRRLTMVVREGRIEHVLYPVFPPDQAATDVLAVLTR
ncbi:MAG: peroxiredoxin [Nocardioidaceae bacterium]|jgi:peroxiredoxin